MSITEPALALWTCGALWTCKYTRGVVHSSIESGKPLHVTSNIDGHGYTFVSR